VDVYLYSLLTSTLDRSGQLHDSAPVAGTRSRSNCIASRADLDSLVERKKYLLLLPVINTRLLDSAVQSTP
jgi:hypothetical protein